MQLLQLHRELNDRCDVIDERWAAQGYCLETFPNIVLSETESLDLLPFGKLEALVPILNEASVAKHQKLSSFSDLYIKVYDNGRFWVEILNWWGSDINIHDHDFSGVQFQLEGCSLNVGYEFEEQQVYDQLRIGVIEVVDAEMWSPGSRSVVLPGRKTPHNVCHLNIPTVSLLIRTHPSRDFGPQWNYFPPGIAANYGVADVIFRKKVQALRLLARGDFDSFRTAFRQYTLDLPPAQLLFSLIKMIDILFEDRFTQLLHELANSGDKMRERIVEAAVYYRAIESIKYMKNTSELSFDDQLALAVLSSGFDQRSIGAISDSIRRLGCGLDLDWSLKNVRSNLHTRSQGIIDNTMELFELAA